MSKCIEYCRDVIWTGRYLPDDSYGNMSQFSNDNTLHYVAYALPGLTFAAEYMRMIGFETDTYKNLFYTVNEKNEPVTLYPTSMATILPYHIANYYMESIEHREKTTKSDIKNYMKDIVFANTKYFQANTILFDLRDFYKYGDRFYPEEFMVQNTIQMAKEIFWKSHMIEKIIILTNFRIRVKIRTKAELEKIAHHNQVSNQKREQYIRDMQLFESLDFVDKIEKIAKDTDHTPDYYPVDLKKISDEEICSLPADIRNLIKDRFESLRKKEWNSFWKRLNTVKKRNERET